MISFFPLVSQQGLMQFWSGHFRRRMVLYRGFFLAISASFVWYIYSFFMALQSGVEGLFLICGGNFKSMSKEVQPCQGPNMSFWPPPEIGPQRKHVNFAPDVLHMRHRGSRLAYLFTCLFAVGHLRLCPKFKEILIRPPNWVFFSRNRYPGVCHSVAFYLFRTNYNTQ